MRGGSQRALVALGVVLLGGASVAAASGGLPLSGAAPPTSLGQFGLRPATAVPSPARTPGTLPSASPRTIPSVSPVASPAVTSSEVVAVASQTDQKMTLVDPATGKATRSIDLGIPARSLAVKPDGRTAWVFSNKPGESDFSIVDLAKGERKDTKRLHDNPSAAAFSTDGRRAYVALAGGNDSPPAASSILFLSTKNDDEFGHVDVGVESPGVQILRRLDALAVVPGQTGDVLYAAAHESGTVWALDAGSGALLQQIEVGGGPVALFADTARKRVYVLTDTTNELVIIDNTTQRIVQRLALPGAPSAGAAGPDGTVYLVGGDTGQLWSVSPDLTHVDDAIPVGKQPAALGLGLDGAHVYVALRGEGSLAVVDPHTRQVTGRIPVGKDPVGILVTAAPPAAGSTATPTPAPVADPSPTPTVVPTATPLPEGASPPEHMPAGAASDAFVSDANYPVAFVFAPDGTLFYNELKTGKIRIVRNGQLLPDPFYQFKVAGQPETGLLGLTLDPDFVDNHYVYVFYTSVPAGQDNGGTNGPNEVVRLTDVADKGTDLTPILENLPSGPIHNSGTIRFGPDGELYVSLGDNDQGSNAQDLGTLAGKILRVNPDGSIPSDNPFAGQDGKQGAIWAYGLRNPFGFDFDPVSHQLLLTENGPGDNDELDLAARGSNFGWPPSGYKYRSGIVDPIAVMNPPIGPTGMTFYTGDLIPDWKNDWFYCNYHQGQLRRVRLAPESRDRVVFEEVVKNGCSLDVATGPDGALYYSNPKGISRIYSAGATNLLPGVTAAASTVATASTPVPDTSATPQPTPTPTEAQLPAGTRPEDRDINLSLTEWKLQPSRSRVPAGEIRFLAEDTGATQHAFRIVGQGMDVSTDDFGPGDSRTLNMVLPPGEYQLVCPIPGHQQQGMSATLTVVGS
jgi:YVTN family beta-propeller protein